VLVPAVTLSTNNLTFSNQTLNVASPAQPVTLTNTGTGDLDISSIATSGDFGETNTCGATVAAGNGCTISITFTPTVTGTRNGAVTITDNAGDSPEKINLTGTGLNLVPTISGILPTSATAGELAQTLTINGSNFVSTSTVTYNGVAHTATFISASQLTITLSSSDQATAGTYPVVVTNPSPGGGASNSVSFTVNSSALAWQQVPGLLSQISVGSDGTVWGLNSAGQIYMFNSQTQTWQQVPGLLAQIAVGSSSFVFGLNGAGQIYRYDASSQGWDQIPGILSQLAVGCDGDLWGINSGAQVFHFNSGQQTWVQVPGALAQLAVGADGTVWGLNNANQIWRFNAQKQSWDSIAGQLTQISVGADAVVWGVNASGQTYEYW